MQREAAEITEQAMVTGSEGTGEGVSHAAAVDADAASEVEPSGHFRIYLGAAPGVGKTYAMLSEGHRRRSGSWRCGSLPTNPMKSSWSTSGGTSLRSCGKPASASWRPSPPRHGTTY